MGEEQACEKIASHTYNYDTVHGDLHHDDVQYDQDDDDDGDDAGGKNCIADVKLWVWHCSVNTVHYPGIKRLQENCASHAIFFIYFQLFIN